MKKTKLFTSMLFLFTITYFSNANAHVGLHDNNNQNLHIWKNIVTNKEIKASFLTFMKNTVYLEKEDGNIEFILLNELSKENYNFVRNKIQNIEKINNSPNLINFPDYKTNNILIKKDIDNYLSSNISFAVIFILLFFIILKLELFQNLSLKKSFRGFIFAPSIVFLSCSLVANTQNEQKASNNPNTILDSSKNAEKNLNTTNNIVTAFDFFKERVKTRKDNDYFYIESNGIPDHEMMVGITSWQQQVPLPQNYYGNNAWSIPLNPVLSDNPISTKNNFYRGAIAVAVNGIPIFNALNNRGDDALLFGELDKWGGHCGRADDYHYHIAPMNLEKIIGKNKALAYALDGFALYGSSEPDGSVLKTLDENNGHFDENKVYHYHATSTYPYTIGKMRGVVKTDGEQIIPQPRTKPIRPSLEPLRGAVITDFKILGNNAYSLEYTLNGNKNYVKYQLDNQDYKFEYIDFSGKSTTSIFKSNN